MATNLPSKVYVSAQQQQMLDTAKTFGHAGLSNEVLQMERDFSRKVTQSRIVDQTQYFNHSVMLLGQHNSLLKSILGNTLIEDLKSKKLPPNPRYQIDMNKRSDGTVACGIYLNYLLDPKGIGLTVPAYETFVEGMIACIENRRMRGGNRNNFDIDDAATQWFFDYTKKAVSEIPDMRKSCAANLKTFKQSQKDLIAAAKAQNATEIRLMGEAGMSTNVHKRCYKHDKLEGSANFFRLARCVLNALWPARGFTLHSFYCFRAFSVEHVEYGEGIATHLVGGYPAYGGLNYTQAGMQIESAKKLGRTGWRKMARENVETREVMEDNLIRMIKRLNGMIEGYQSKLDISRRLAALNAAREQLDRLFTDLNSDTATQEQAQYCSDELDAMKKYIDNKDRETQKMIESVQNFIRGVGAANEVPQFTQTIYDSESESEQEEEKKKDNDKDNEDVDMEVNMPENDDEEDEDVDMD